MSSVNSSVSESQQQKRAQAQALRTSALALAANGAVLEAMQALLQAAALAPAAPIIRLNMGQLHERAGDHDAATRAYFLAVMKARAQGLWIDDASVPPALLPQVLHAMHFVEQHRDAVLLALMNPLNARFGANAMRRVQQSLDIYLGHDLTRPQSPLQRPLFLYVPGLSETPYLDPAQFDWVEQALDLRCEIAREAQAVLTQASGITPFLEATNDADLSAYLRSSTPAKAGWDAYFFYRHGNRFDAHLQQCPAATQLLNALTKIDIAEHAPEICFSVLAGGTNILPHTGVTNSRVVAHLPLILPGQCALKVAGIERAWRIDEVLIFDDTFEHEAWNRSPSERVILLMDTWHPDLHAEEREAIAEIVREIGVFNRGD